jgi:hypothetical protein
MSSVISKGGGLVGLIFNLSSISPVVKTVCSNSILRIEHLLKKRRDFWLVDFQYLHSNIFPEDIVYSAISNTL